jgi:hypothetical protein
VRLFPPARQRVVCQPASPIAATGGRTANLIPTGLTVRLPRAAANRQEKSLLFSVLREQEWRELVAPRAAPQLRRQRTDVAGLSAQLALVFEEPRDPNVDHRFTPTQQQAFRADLECELARLLDWFRRRAWPDLRWIEHLFVQGLIQLQICKMPPKAVA